jgi:hypothetical protein
MHYLLKNFLIRINQRLIPQTTILESIDSSGMKIHQRGVWVRNTISAPTTPTEFQEGPSVRGPTTNISK